MTEECNHSLPLCLLQKPSVRMYSTPACVEWGKKYEQNYAHSFHTRIHGENRSGEEKNTKSIHKPGVNFNENKQWITPSHATFAQQLPLGHIWCSETVTVHNKANKVLHCVHNNTHFFYQYTWPSEHWQLLHAKKKKRKKSNTTQKTLVRNEQDHWHFLVLILMHHIHRFVVISPHLLKRKRKRTCLRKSYDKK